MFIIQGEIIVKNNKLTKGQLEAQISNELSKFEKEYMGRGPKEIKTKIIQNHILIIIDGFLSQSEQKLAENEQGKKLVKDLRLALFDSSREQLISLIQELIGIRIISVHSDVSTKTGEKVVVLTIEGNLEEHLS
jgi:uncharacterized protein YbcI